MGSIESSLREKRIWAIDSLLFNLKNDTFREIFSAMIPEMFAKLADSQKRRLKEDFIKRKIKLDVFPELMDIQLDTAKGGPSTANGVCDRNNNKGVAVAALAGGEGGTANNNNDNNLRSWSIILAVIVAGLTVNYVLKYLKVNNFYD